MSRIFPERTRKNENVSSSKLHRKSHLLRMSSHKHTRQATKTHNNWSFSFISPRTLPPVLCLQSLQVPKYTTPMRFYRKPTNVGHTYRGMLYGYADMLKFQKPLLACLIQKRRFHLPTHNVLHHHAGQNKVLEYVWDIAENRPVTWIQPSRT